MRTVVSRAGAGRLMGAGVLRGGAHLVARTRLTGPWSYDRRPRMTQTDDLLGVAAARAASLAAPGLGAAPRRRVTVLTCMDARIDPVAMLGLEPGDAHVLRNAGGIVTDDVLRSLLLSQRLLGTRAVMVIHHTRCGALGLAEEKVKSEIQSEVGLR